MTTTGIDKTIILPAQIRPFGHARRAINEASSRPDPMLSPRKSAAPTSNDAQRNARRAEPVGENDSSAPHRLGIAIANKLPIFHHIKGSWITRRMSGRIRKASTSRNSTVTRMPNSAASRPILRCRGMRFSSRAPHLTAPASAGLSLVLQTLHQHWQPAESHPSSSVETRTSHLVRIFTPPAEAA